MMTLRQVYYSFPVRLLALHFRNHLLLVSLWVALGLMMTGIIGRFFGMHYLLLTPEYRGEVDFWSFFITGAAFGVFFMIWNLTTYLLSASRFSFLATLNAPFTKFSLNNALIPLLFLGAYLTASTVFQLYDEFSSPAMIVQNIAGFICGAASLIGALAAYLYLTNKDIAAFLKPGKFVPRPGGRLLAPGWRLPTLGEIRAGATRWRVDTYLNERLRPRPVRSVLHYDPAMLDRVFSQNHLNAVIVQIGALVLLMVLGLFMDSPWARIPTGATLFLLFSMVMAIFGAVTFWFRTWGVLVFGVILLVINYVTGLGFFNYRNQAYGLDYSRDNRAEYSYAAFEKLNTPENIQRDKEATLRILNNWLAKNKRTDNTKPKLVFVCVSGGGLRSALWVMRTMQEADKATGGRLMSQTMMISGASGGMLGAAYVREAYLRSNNGEALDYHDPALIDDMGKDLLNPVSFAIISNDLLVPMRTFEYGNFRYYKDRGYLLERQLNENCRGMFSKKLADYRLPEQQALAPMMVVTPFVLNDARKMLISPQGLSYLMSPPDDGRYALDPEVDAVDFGKLFAGQQADSLAFSSALRMNCTFPLILPNIWLPTQPGIEVVDAGFRDNYGLSTPSRFVHVFRDWIQENTSGVVFVQVRCWEKVDQIAPSDTKGVLESLLTPANAAANMTAIQDYEQDNALALLDDLLGKNRLQIIRFTYRPVMKEREASLSLHLSKREKRDLYEAFDLPENQAALKQLQEALR